jgi:glycerate-2-kinase
VPDGNVDNYRNAINMLKRYEVWDRVPESVRRYLLRADPTIDRIRPGELEGKPIYHFRVMGPEYMLEAARQKAAEELGLSTSILVSSLNNIEVRPVGVTLANVAREAEVSGRPLKPPCVFILGGELLVTVGKATGMGGRNQEFVLSAAPTLAGSENIVFASVDSDGTDGPSDAAGGIVDGYTLDRLEEESINVADELRNHNSYGALKRLGDNIFTGARGTNVRDLRVIYVRDRMPRSRLVEEMNKGRTSLQWG